LKSLYYDAQSEKHQIHSIVDEDYSLWGYTILIGNLLTFQSCILPASFRIVEDDARSEKHQIHSIVDEDYSLWGYTILIGNLLTFQSSILPASFRIVEDE